MKRIVFLVLASLLVLSCNGQNESTDTFDAAFVHSVYIWLKNPESTKDRAAFEASMETFMKNSLYAKTKFLGTPPKASREIVDDSYTYNLIVTFASAEDQDKYQKEEAHLKFIEESEHLWKKVLIYDAIGPKEE
ncbi:Dabb family protein [Muriicola soli]|uniref:Dabb family protein n=1 Tax=Muriicola soli TaxID=2507538 RepID=A0A411E6E1_9FLAO|nr:Dabb family protein [Muriicola soli]QBA63249.1 Dabb family protein [Muriicola soli]